MAHFNEQHFNPNHFKTEAPVSETQGRAVVEPQFPREILVAFRDYLEIKMKVT